MMKIKLRIAASVEIGGRKPGEEFMVKATDDKTPLDLYWRRRLADGSAVLVADPAPAARPAAPPKAAAKKD